MPFQGGVNVRCRAIAPAASDQAGSPERSWRPPAAQSQEREGLLKTKVAGEFTSLKNSAVRLASCQGWKNKRN